MKITINYERWSVPDYRNGETEEDSRLRSVEVVSDTLNTTITSLNMENEEVITVLTIVRSVLNGAIKAEKGKFTK